MYRIYDIVHNKYKEEDYMNKKTKAKKGISLIILIVTIVVIIIIATSIIVNVVNNRYYR